MLTALFVECNRACHDVTTKCAKRYLAGKEVADLHPTIDV